MNTVCLLPLDNSKTVPIDPDLPHVVLVLDQFPKTLGGGERIALKLACLLPGYGFRASIVSFFIHPESAVRASAPCPVYLLPLQRTYDLTALRSAFVFRRFLEEEKVAIVQTFFESSDIWAGLVTKTMSNARLIWSRRDLGILRAQKHRVAYRLMAKLPDAVIAVSEQVRSHCIEVDRVDPAIVHTVYNGLDITRWPSPPVSSRSPDELLVVTVGNIRRVKGHDILIRAAAAVVQRFPKVRFSIAGEVLEGDYFEEIQNLIRDLGLSAHFQFAGNVTDLQQYLAAADLFVLPSRSEGFSNALVEAMAAGLPIVATDVGGNSEAIQTGVNGFLVPSENPERLAEAMIALISNPTQARSLGLCGRELATKRFTTEAMMHKTIEIYRTLLDRVGSPR
jgi:glycosyltransferase involved in cell wall biosynthesis